MMTRRSLFARLATLPFVGALTAHVRPTQPPATRWPLYRVQQRCSLRFPQTAAERIASPALNFGNCGYCPDAPDPLDRVGRLDAEGKPFTHCHYTAKHCAERGMLQTMNRVVLVAPPATVTYRAWIES